MSDLERAKLALATIRAISAIHTMGKRKPRTVEKDALRSIHVAAQVGLGGNAK